MVSSDGLSGALLAIVKDVGEWLVSNGYAAALWRSV